MINFRFHIASLIAVFLALALGVVMGSTVIDRAIVDGLRNRINDVDSKAETQKARNAELQGELNEVNKYVEESAPWAVDRQLTDQAVAVIAQRGLDDDTVKEQAALLQQSGASVPGILWLEAPWNLGGDGKNADGLRAALGVTTKGDKLLRSEAITALTRRLSQGAAPAAGPDVLDALAKAGFVTLEGVGNDDVTAATFPAPGVRALVLGGPESSVAARSTTIDLTRALVAASVLTAVGELDPSDAANPRGTWIALIRNDDDLKQVVSTIDNVDVVQGRVASVLALADLARGVVGAYGSGAGAQATVPPIPVPAG